LEQDALLPGNLSSKGVMFSDQEQDNDIQSNSSDSSNTQPSNLQGPKQKSLVISARVPFATFCSNLSSGLVYCWVCSHTGFESVTSTKKVSCSTFALVASEPVTFTTKVSCNTFALLVCVSVASTNKIKADSDFSNFKRQIFINNKANSNVSQFLSSILQPNEMCSTSHLAANEHKGLFDSKSLSNNDFRLVVNSKLILHSEGEHTTKPNGLISDDLVYFDNHIGLVSPIELVELIGRVGHTNDFVGPSQLIVESKYSKISLYFCKDCRIFCEGKWRKQIIKKDGKAIINAINRNNLPL
jgi:hypothetical protein